MVKNFLKIVSDISCDVYINTEKVTSLAPIEMKEIPLPQGEYLVQLISDKNPKYRVLKRVSLSKDTLLYVEFAKEMKSHPEWIDYSDLGNIYTYDGKYGIVNKVLNVTLVPAIYSIVNFEEHDWYLTQSDIFRGCDSTLYCIDHYFQSRLLETREINGYFLKGLMCVSKDGKYGFVNYYGEEVVPLIYDSASDFWGDLAKVKRGNKWGFIDTLGNVVVDFIYDNAANFNNGLARVVRDNLYGFIDDSGEEVVPCQYSYAHDFINDSAVVCSEKYGVINKNGELLYPMELDSLVYEDDHVIVGCKGDYYGILDRDGKEKDPFNYSYFDVVTRLYPPVDDWVTWRELPPEDRS
jgi:hypothetical protein